MGDYKILSILAAATASFFFSSEVLAGASAPVWGSSYTEIWKVRQSADPESSLARRSKISYESVLKRWPKKWHTNWKEDWERERAELSHIVKVPSISRAKRNQILKDPANRIPKLFQVPRGMEAQVGFWLDIYTKYHSKQAIIYDKSHPEVVYEIMNFAGTAKRAKSYKEYRAKRSAALRKKMKAYRVAFKRLKKRKFSKKWSSRNRKTREERIILKKLKNSKHKHSYNHLAKQLRIQTGQRNNIVMGLRHADRFFPMMEEFFEEQGIPREITRLTLVESSFNPKAVSRSGAVGVWQFMRATGHEYLYINRKKSIDERRSPLKSTVAAARLLNRNYRITESWPLALSAYHSGHRRLAGLTDSQKEISKLKQIFSLCYKDRKKSYKKVRLGFAGRNYYPSFLAALHAEKYRDVFFKNEKLPPIPRKHIAFHQLHEEKTPLEFIAEIGMGIESFLRLNPDVVRLDIRLPKGYWLTLPKRALGSIAVKKHSTETWLERFAQMKKFNTLRPLFF